MVEAITWLEMLNASPLHSRWESIAHHLLPCPLQKSTWEIQKGLKDDSKLSVSLLPRCHGASLTLEDDIQASDPRLGPTEKRKVRTLLFL